MQLAITSPSRASSGWPGWIWSGPPVPRSPSALHRGQRLTPRPRHGLGAYFGEGAALWDDPQLVRDDALAAAVIDAMGSSNAVVMRGNGLVVAADSLPEVVSLTWYLEDAARLELAVRGAGLQDASAVLDAAECERRATRAGGIFERMWDYLTAGDPELAV